MTWDTDDKKPEDRFSLARGRMSEPREELEAVLDIRATREGPVEGVGASSTALDMRLNDSEAES
jgi:hypothetical protein